MAAEFVEAALARIALTPDVESSRVALFNLPKSPGRVHVVFAQTVETQRAIERKDSRYIGTFCETSSSADVLKAIAKVRGLCAG